MAAAGSVAAAVAAWPFALEAAPLAVPARPVAVTAAVTAAPQDPDPPARTVALDLSPADSADLRGDARDAQARFERVRLRHLPTILSWGSGGCHDRVGRMCWSHETGGLWTPEPEDPEVGEARERLLDELAAVAAALPGDGWVLGQRVWYLLEAGRPDEARTVARSCGGAPAWWCATLEGLALHVEGHYPEAEAAFDRALERMSPERAREWTDVRRLLDRSARGALEDAAERSPAEGEAMLRRLWAVSDPFHLVPGNDRRSEHFARRTVSRIRSDAQNPHGIPWGDDLEELLVRYGWGVGWERILPEPGAMRIDQRVIGHEHPESRSFIPPGVVLRDPASASAERWTPGLSYARSAYAPTYAPVVLPMDSRIVVFPRGDRALVAAPFAMPEDTTYRGLKGVRDEPSPPPALAGEPVAAGLFLTDVASGEMTEAHAGGTDRGVLTVEVPAGSYWASVELVAPELGRAGRHRRGLDVPSVPPELARVSDLILLEPGPLPDDIHEALSRMKVDDTLVSGRSVVVGWEIWGLGWRPETLRYRLTLADDGGGFFQRVGQAIGLVDPERPGFLEWEEPGPERPGPSFRSISMDMPELDPGEYLLRLEVHTPGRTPLLSERRIRVVEPGG